tara:strand:- start:132 stop:791 length:660 start_codon:yes stop_codon:yes gene_type:complete
MKFFLDTAEVEEIKALIPTGLIDGVTTNPSLIAKSGRNFLKVVEEICKLIKGPVSAEVTSTDSETMVAEGMKLSKISENVVVKVPLTENGLRACKKLSLEQVKVNVTLCFSAGQAILAAKAGAAYISPFIGRLDDISRNGMGLIQDICAIYSHYENFKTEVLVASIRSPNQVVESAKLGADVCTIPPSVVKQLFKHPLTNSGLTAFLADWDKSGQSILE